MQRVGGAQPDVAVDAGAFVEPALAEGGVHAHGDDVPGAVVKHVAEVDLEAAVAAAVAADDVAVAEHDAVAEHAVEFQADPLAQVLRRNLQHAPVPADAGLRIGAAQRCVAMRGSRVFAIDQGGGRVLARRQRHRPVVRQVDALPVAVVEGEQGGVGGVLAALGVGALEGAEMEVARRIVGVAEMETPAAIAQQAQARCVVVQVQR